MKQFAVLGLGKFGAKVAFTLAKMNMQVIAIDNDPRRVELMADKLPLVLNIDATDKRALESAGVSGADAAVVSLGETLEPSILATIILREFNVKEIVVKGNNLEHSKMLKIVGATQVVFPEEDMAERIAQRIISPNIVEYIPLLPDYSIVELVAPEQFWGNTLLDLNLRNNFGVELLIIRRGETVKVIPSAMDKIEKGDTLVILGKNEDVQKLKSSGE